MNLDELPLPTPSWYAIDTPGADVDVTFVTTKGEALDYCETGSGFDEQAAPLFSADHMRAAMRAGALAALDEAFNRCANDPDHRLEVIRRLRDTIAKGESE